MKTNRISLSPLKGLFFLFFVLHIFVTLSSYELPFSSPYNTHDEQSLHVQRIVDFFEEGDFELCQKEANDFLQKFPNSPYNQSLLVLIGDLYFHEESYAQASAFYAKVSSLELQKKITSNYLKSLYKLGQFTRIIQTAQKYLNSATEDQELIRFYLAESLLRSNLNPQARQAEQISRASELYANLTDSNYKLAALEGLALSYQLLNEAEKSSSYYIKLSELDKESQDHWRYLAATVLREKQPQKALELLNQILSSNNDYHKQALFDKTLILYSLEDFQKINLLARTDKNAIELGKWGYFQYLLGRSYYFQKAYQQCLPHLRQATKTSLPHEQLKQAYLSMADAALALDDLSLIEEIFLQYQAELPPDENLAKIQLAEAILVAKNNPEKAALKLQGLLEQFPDFTDKDKVYFDLSQWELKANNFESARHACLTLIDNFPSSSYFADSLKLLVSINQKRLDFYKGSKRSLPKSIQQEFAQDLEKIFQYPHLLNPSELDAYLFAKGSLYYELGQYEKSIQALEEQLKLPSHESRFESHLLLALSYEKQHSDLNRFTYHSEKILALDPNWNQSSKVHLNLFNSYVQLLSEIDPRLPTEEKKQQEKQYHVLMAKHLYAALESKNLQLDKQNLFWLANYYYLPLAQDFEKKWDMIVNANSAQQIKKAIKSFEKALINEQGRFVILNEQQTIEGLKLSRLYGWLPLPSKQISLLENLIEISQASSNKITPSRILTMFEYAQVLEKYNRIQDSLHWYEQVVLESPNVNSYHKAFAQLHLNKLKFSQIPLAERNKDNPIVTNTLSKLKDLQINRSLLSEPVHLEAAISYAELKSSLYPKNEQTQTLLSLLQKVKRDFLKEDDVVSKDYHTARRKLDDKNQLFQAYMLLVDAKINFTEAQIAKEKEDNPYNIQNKLETSQSLLQKISTGTLALTPFLSRQASKELKRLKEML